MVKRITDLFVVASVIVLINVSPVFAYIGPGAGVSAIGSLLALVAVVIVAILGFLWFPVKRLLRSRRAASIKRSEATPAAETEDADQ